VGSSFTGSGTAERAMPAKEIVEHPFKCGLAGVRHRRHLP
jgi:hypothetical protein